MMCLQHATAAKAATTTTRQQQCLIVCKPSTFSGQMRRLIPDTKLGEPACTASWSIINLVSAKCLLHIHSWQMNGLQLQLLQPKKRINFKQRVIEVHYAAKTLPKEPRRCGK